MRRIRYSIVLLITASVVQLLNALPLKHVQDYPVPASIPNSINSLEEDHIHRAMGDVAATIAEVQKILQTDPTLPRLTTGEIEELFENVTQQEMERSLRNGDHDRAKHMKALMLVLPYNTHNVSDARLQELYTRPPITKVINSEVKPQKPQKIIISSENRNNKTPKDNHNSYQKPTTFHPRPSNIPTINKETTTTTIAPSSKKPERYSSHYSAERPPFPKIQQRPPIRENVRDLLATIGLTQEVLPTTTRKPELTPELQKLLESFGLLTNEEPPKHLQFDINPDQEEFQPIKNQQNSFEDTNSHSSGYKRSSFRMNISPELTPDDFYAFKPLPISKQPEVNTEMQEFLRRFGLVNNNQRGQKSMKRSQPSTDLPITTRPVKTSREVMKKMPDVRVDFLTPELKNVLGNIGIQRRSFEVKDSSESKEYISSKSSNVNLDPQQKKQLNLLLDTIQELQKLNANLTDEEWDTLYNKLVAVPDPVEHLEHEAEIKNEVKRQSAELTTENSSPIRITLDLKATTEENAEFNPTDATILTNDTLTQQSKHGVRSPDENSISSTAISEADISISTSTTTEDSRNSLNLDETFSGDLDPITETPLPVPRRNGFYFLADWNSFLEVGEDPDKVVVRFDPKIGDPSRFIPVNVP